MTRAIEIAAWTGERASVIVVTLGSVLLAVAPEAGVWVIALGVALGGAGFAADVKVRRDGRRRLLQLRSFTGVDNALLDLGVEMALPAPWRLSLYCTTPDDGESYWHRIARASNAATFHHGGRVQIPSGEGVLWMAEETGTANELRGVPDRTVDEAGFLHFHESRRVSASTARRFRMPSSTYVAVVYRIHGADARQQVSVGLVAESANRDRDGDLSVQLVQRFASRILLENLYRSSVLDSMLSSVTVIEVGK